MKIHGMELTESQVNLVGIACQHLAIVLERLQTSGYYNIDDLRHIIALISGHNNIDDLHHIVELVNAEVSETHQFWSCCGNASSKG